jgi:hypothetical protein
VTLRKKPRRLSTSWPGAIAGLGGLDALVNNADFQWPLPRIGWIPPISTASSRSTSAAPCCAGPVSHPDSCGGSRRLAPGPEVQPGRTAFPFTRSRGTDDAQLYLYHCGGQTADPIGFARVASAPIGGALRFMPMCKYDVHNAIPSNNASSYILHRSRRRVRLWSVLHVGAERIPRFAACD